MDKHTQTPLVAKNECSTREAGRLLDVSVSTVQMWVDSGELEAWKTVGGHRRISMASVQRLLQQRGGQVQAAPAAPEPAPASGVSVLVVEDDADLLSLYEAVLSSWELPLTLRTASNGFEGLLEVGRMQPDVLITDLHMPGMDGFEMLRALRADERCAGMEIVVVSGLDVADISARGSLPAGVHLYRKPVPFERIAALLQAVTARKG